MRLPVSLPIALVATLAGVGCTKAAEPTPAAPPAASPVAVPVAAARAPQKVDGATAKALVAGGAVLLDVRTPEEYADGHVDGARNVPVDTLAGALAQLPKDKPIVVYCAVGMRAARAARLLAESGYDARDLGAMGNWPK